MTPHEAGPTLDKLVAEKVMGWLPHGRNTGLYVPVAMINEAMTGGTHRIADWRPSTNIVHAFEMQSHIKVNKCLCDIYVWALRRILLKANGGELHDIHLLEASPFHRCLAALKAVDGDAE